MRAYTISGMNLGGIGATRRFGGFQLGATKDEAASILALTTTAIAQAQAAAAAAANSNADIPQASLALNYGYAPASTDIVGPSSSKLPWILGGVGAVVLGVGAYFLLRKKRR